MRPPLNDPYQRRKNFTMRAERQVIEAADELARRYGISRNDALNAIVKAFVMDPAAPERFGMLLLAIATGAGAGAGVAEAYRQEAS